VTAPAPPSTGGLIDSLRCLRPRGLIEVPTYQLWMFLHRIPDSHREITPNSQMKIIDHLQAGEALYIWVERGSTSYLIPIQSLGAGLRYLRKPYARIRSGNFAIKADLVPQISLLGKHG
jgi:hypothetical protein